MLKLKSDRLCSLAHEIFPERHWEARESKSRGLFCQCRSLWPSGRNYVSERFEPRSHFKSRLILIVRLNVALNRTVVVDSDWRFDNLCGSHLQSQSELYHVSWWCYTLVIDLIGQLRRDVIGRLSVKPWCYWLWRLVISNWCVSIRLERKQKKYIFESISNSHISLSF